VIFAGNALYPLSVLGRKTNYLSWTQVGRITKLFDYMGQIT